MPLDYAAIPFLFTEGVYIIEKEAKKHAQEPTPTPAPAPVPSKPLEITAPQMGGLLKETVTTTVAAPAHAPATQMEPTGTSAFKHLWGEGEKQVLIVVDESVTSTGAEAGFLRKILQAVQLEDQDVKVFAQQDTSAKVMELVNQEQAAVTIAFIGADKVPPGKHIYITFSLKGKQYIFGETLSKVQADQNQKKALWAALQKVFVG